MTDAARHPNDDQKPQGRILVAGGSRARSTNPRHSDAYRDYINSPQWKAKREAVLTRDKHTCRRCGQAATEVHHKTYDHLGQEPYCDLESLCAECHRKADQERESKKSARRWDARLDGWASKRYGEDWEETYDYGVVEEEFDRWLEDRDGD